MTMIVAEPLSIDLFKPFGTVLDSKDQLATAHSANNGTALKKIDACVLSNSNENAKPKLNLFQCTPPPLETNELGYTYNGIELEKHPFSSQTFVPLGRSADYAYLVIVAQGGEEPDLSTLSAFVCTGKQAITYNAGIWHAPMVALFETTDFAVFISESGIPNEDCVTTPLHYSVEFGTNQLKQARSAQTEADYESQLQAYKGPPTTSTNRLVLGDQNYQTKQVKYKIEHLYFHKQYEEVIKLADEHLPNLHPKVAKEVEEVKQRSINKL